MCDIFGLSKSFFNYVQFNLHHCRWRTAKFDLYLEIMTSQMFIFVIFSRWVSQDLITWVTNQVHIPMNLLTLLFISCLQFFNAPKYMSVHFRSFREYFSQIETSLLQVEGCKFMPKDFTLGAPTICSIYQYLHLWSIKVRLSLPALFEQTIIVSFLFFFLVTRHVLIDLYLQWRRWRNRSRINESIFQTWSSHDKKNVSRLTLFMSV